MQKGSSRPTSRVNFRAQIILAGCGIAALLSAPAMAGDGNIRKSAHPITHQYIVKLNDSLAPAAVRSLASALERQQGGKLHHVSDAIVPSFTIEVSEEAAKAIARHPSVDFVEEDSEWTISQVQSSAPWHLDRIDQRFLPLDGAYQQGCVTTDVYAYVLDTGVRASHREFWTNSVNSASRVLPGSNIYPDAGTETNPCTGVTVFDQPAPPCGSGDRQCLGGGHGTAVASVLGGLTYGVAKSVKIIPVRTHSCSGISTTSYIAQGLEWIYNDKPSRSGPAVLNISSGMTLTPGSPQTVAEMWIDRLINERNITVVVAANNQEIDVSGSSPARVANAITVAGSTTADRRWHCNSSNAFEQCFAGNTGSNFGSGVDIFAPAQNIASAGIKQSIPPGDPYYVYGPCCQDSDTAQRQGQLSGTSFAAPAVAGIAARLLIGSGASLTPAQVWQQIQAQASGDSPSTPPAVMHNQEGDPNAGDLFSPNRLLFMQGVTRCRVGG
jgi:subtilisin family serine protease